MALEAATFIADLVATNPVGATDPVAQGDDHLRLLKAVLQATIPFTGLVTATHTELNQLHGGVIASVAAGTVGAPAYSFGVDTDLGIYRVGANSLGLAAGGSTPFYIDATHCYPNAQMVALAGSVGAPAYSFVNDPDTGIYSSGANDLSVSVGGSLALEFFVVGGIRQCGFSTGNASQPPICGFSFSTNGFYFGSGQVNVTVAGQDVAQFQNDSSHAGIYMLDGQVAFPSYSFTNDTDSGMMRSVSGVSLVSSGAIFIQGTDTNVFIGQPTGASGVTLAGSLSISNTLTSTGANAGAQGAPPATVAGYIIADINGTARKIPYYNN